MFSHGVDPKLNIDDINEIVEVYERCVKIPVHARHPYRNLVFTAFSGSHQDAINKGMKKYQERHDGIWQVPYLPIDPGDLGREYEALVRPATDLPSTGSGTARSPIRTGSAARPSACRRG